MTLWERERERERERVCLSMCFLLKTKIQRAKKLLISLEITLSTWSLVIPSCQGDSITFQNEKFIQLQGIQLTHPPKVDKKKELKQEDSIYKGIVIYNSPKIKTKYINHCIYLSVVYNLFGKTNQLTIHFV